MTTRDLLGVAIRAIGAYFLASALDDATVAIMRAAGLPFHTQYTWQEDFDIAISFAIVGAVFFAAADTLVRIAFDREGPKE